MIALAEAKIDVPQIVVGAGAGRIENDGAPERLERQLELPEITVGLTEIDGNGGFLGSAQIRVGGKSQNCCALERVLGIFEISQLVVNHTFGVEYLSAFGRDLFSGL